MATTEQSIADLASAVEALLELPQQLADVGTQQITRVSDDFAARIATLQKEVHVDQINGLDTNNGSDGSPIQTLQHAQDMVPFGGRVVVHLHSDCALQGSDLSLVGKQMVIRPADSVRKTLTFERYDWVSGSTTYAAIRNIGLRHGSSIELDNMRVVMPPVDGAWGLRNIQNWAAFRVPWFTDFGGVPHVGMHDVELDIPALPFAPICDNLGGTFSLYCDGVVTPNQPLLGEMFSSITNAAGTDVNNVPWLISNLTQV